MINNKLKKLRIAPSELCTDEEFLRRVSLDIIGTLPSIEEYHRFVNDKTPTKREKLVDELLGRKEFVEMWVLKWAELLQIKSSNQVSYKAMLLYYNWLQDKIARNIPVNEWVQELLGANGGTFKTPPPTIIKTKPTFSKSTKMSPKCSWECVFNAPNATTTLSIAGPWTTITDSWLFQPNRP